MNLSSLKPPEGSRKKRKKWIRRVLAATATAVVLTQTPIPGAVGDFLRGIGEDSNRPGATEANMGGQSIINVGEVRLETGNTAVWPVLRENPAVHDGNDGFNPNGVSWGDVKTINGAPIDVEPGTETTITVNNPAFVKGGNADNATPGAPQGLWEEVDVVRKDGTEENDYLSVSEQTGGRVTLELSGVMTPLNQQDGNSLGDKVNETTVVTKPASNP